MPPGDQVTSINNSPVVPSGDLVTSDATVVIHMVVMVANDSKEMLFVGINN